MSRVKYKVGDRVRIVSCRTPEMCSQMDKYFNTVMTIVYVYDSYMDMNPVYDMKEDNKEWAWTNDMIVGIEKDVKEESNSIHGVKKIIQNNDATVVIFDGNKKVVVKRHENEPYDHYTALAFAITKHTLGSFTALEEIVNHFGLEDNDSSDKDNIPRRMSEYDDMFMNKYIKLEPMLQDGYIPELGLNIPSGMFKSVKELKDSNEVFIIDNSAVFGIKEAKQIIKFLTDAINLVEGK